MYKPTLLALALLLPLAGCGRDSAPAGGASAGEDEGFIARTTRKALEQAREEITKGNIRVGGGDVSGGLVINGQRIGNTDGSLPKAEISPQGDLLIDGKVVPVDEAQRKRLLEHRANVIAIAEAGIAIGMQGAQLGTQAASGALASVFSGNTGEFEKKMEAEGAKIEAEALKLCDRLPPLLESQQALAAALPAFQPYATMEATDIEDCRDRSHHVDGQQIGREAAQAVAQVSAAAKAGGVAAIAAGEAAGTAASSDTNTDAAAEADRAAGASKQ